MTSTSGKTNLSNHPPGNVRSIQGYREEDDEGPIFRIEPRILVPPGKYEMAYVSASTHLAFKRAAKLAVRFRIINPGKQFEVELTRWYNVKRLIGKPRRGGNFQAAPHGDFLREYLTLFPEAAGRLDRLSFKPFRSVIIIGRVETVTHNQDQKLLPEPMRYSIIRELLEATT